MHLLPFSRAPFIIDLLECSMFFVLALMSYSIYLVKIKKKYQLHKRIQILISCLLLVVIVFFEIDIRLHGWRQYAEISPYYPGMVFLSLFIHIIFATLTLVFWSLTIYHGIKFFDFKNPRPNEYSMRHKKIGKISAVLLFITTITGTIFFYLAFVA